MVEKIYEIKNKLLKRVEQDTQDINRIDVKELGELVDMVKDLAEAESSCWQAEYYKSVTQAMNQEKQGYGSGGGTGSSAGYGSSSARSGYASQTARSGYGSQGYGSQGYGSMGHQDVMEPLRMAIQSAAPDEREHIRNEAKTILGMM